MGKEGDTVNGKRSVKAKTEAGVSGTHLSEELNAEFWLEIGSTILARMESGKRARDVTKGTPLYYIHYITSIDLLKCTTHLCAIFILV